MEKKVVAVTTDTDLLGISIQIAPFTTIDGILYYGKKQRRAFRSVRIDEDGKTLENPEFANQVADWVGDPGWLASYNFSI